MERCLHQLTKRALLDDALRHGKQRQQDGGSSGTCEMATAKSLPSLANDTVDVPQCFPRLIRLPEEDVPLDQTVVPVDLRNSPHLAFGQRVTHDCLEVGLILVAPVREGYRGLTSLY